MSLPGICIESRHLSLVSHVLSRSIVLCVRWEVFIGSL
jgi:hypothetical protein